MKYKVIGKQDVNYVSSRTGKKVQGVNLHCTYQQKNVEGLSVEKLYISSNIECHTVNIGDEIDVYYNKYGGIDEVRLQKNK